MTSKHTVPDLEREDRGWRGKGEKQVSVHTDEQLHVQINVMYNSIVSVQKEYQIESTNIHIHYKTHQTLASYL
jgi:hypothetical protein